MTDASLFLQSARGLGGYYPLKSAVNLGFFESQLEQYDGAWSTIQDGVARSELLLVRNGVENARLLEAFSSLAEPLQMFPRMVESLSLVKFDAGGYLSFEDCRRRGQGHFKFVCLLTRCEVGQFAFIFNHERVILDRSRFYYIDGEAPHAFISFGDSVLFLEVAVRAERGSFQDILNTTLSY